MPIALDAPRRPSLNPTVVVLKPKYNGWFREGDLRSQSNRSGFETVFNYDISDGPDKSQSNRSGFETLPLPVGPARRPRLNPTVVVLKRHRSLLRNA